MPLDQSTLRKISRQENAHRVTNVSSNTGNVAAGVLPSPFGNVNIATMNTQGALRVLHVVLSPSIAASCRSRD